MSTYPLKILADRSLYRGTIDLLVVHEYANLDAAVGLPVVMQRLEPGTMAEQPTLRLRPEDAQGLMDELWRVGLRPTEGTGSAGSLAATERHLADMRSVAFGLLKGEF